MDESVTDEVRRQSILKSRPRFPLQEVQSFFGDEDTVTTTLTRNRRVSFGRKVIKEFLIGSAVSTQAVHEYEQSSESVSDPSDCSGPLDLALNKSCRDLEAELELSGEVITPPESFSDTKAKDSDQRARMFTENCISIAKSVFKDTETELTAIIIGAKPTSSDEDKKNSSCMSFTALEVSNDFRHKAHHDFMSMRHSELLTHSDHVDKGRYDFLDHSLGNTTLSAPAKPTRHVPHSPLAATSRPSAWETETDENIPPAHNSFRNARSSVFRPNVSETTMEFTCARMKSVEPGLSKEDPLGLDATNDEFIDELLEDDTDSSPLSNIQRELANLSYVNQSFRERVGMLNASSAHALNELSNGSELSFLQTPTAGDGKINTSKPQDEVLGEQVDCNNTETFVDWPTPSKGNISVFDETDEGQSMEFTHFNVRHRAVELADDEPLTCSGGEKTKIVEMTMEIEKTNSAGRGSRLAEETQNVELNENEPTMEFTQCNRLRQEAVVFAEKSNEIAELTMEVEETRDSLTPVADESSMEFTQSNRQRPEALENHFTPEKTIEISELAMRVEETSDNELTPPANEKSLKETENSDLKNNFENEPTMEFTQCNRQRPEALEDTLTLEKTKEIAELSMEVEKTCDDLTPTENEKSVEGAENSDLKNNFENEPTMEFTQCNRQRPEALEDTLTLEKTKEIAELSMEVEKTRDDLTPTENEKSVEGAENSDLKNNPENEPTMEFTQCNRLRQESVQKEGTITEEKSTETCDYVPTVENPNSVDETKNSELINNPENEPTMEFTHCNRLPQDIEKSAIFELNEKPEISFDETENSGFLNNLDSEPTMDFTHCNLHQDEAAVEKSNDSVGKTCDVLPSAVEEAENHALINNLEIERSSDIVTVGKSNEIAELTMDVEKTCDDIPAAKSVEESENYALRNEHCNRLDTVNDTVTVEKSNEIAELTMDVEKTCDDLPTAKSIEETFNNLEIEPSMVLRQDEMDMEKTLHENSIASSCKKSITGNCELNKSGDPPEEAANNPTMESQNNKLEITTAGSTTQDDSQTIDNHETDDTLPAEDLSCSLPNMPSERTENMTQMNGTVDAPLETPVTGLAALSARLSLQQQLLSVAPDSTIVSELMEEMEITQGSICGVLPKPMRTMSNEQHMKAVHESTRVISEDTFKIPTDNTYTVFGEATYTIAGKRTHSDSPCPGERLTKTSRFRDSINKRMHTESPLPDQSLLKKSRESHSPRVARNLDLDVNDSLLLVDGVYGNLDVSVTMNDITLSQTEHSFGVLPMSLPERSVVPEEMELTEIAVPVMASVSELDTITMHMPVVAMHSQVVDESVMEVSSMSSEIDQPEARNTTEPDESEATSSAVGNEVILKKVQAALEDMSREKTCTWKLLQFNDGLIRVDLPLVATGLILDISYTDINITSLLMTHRATPRDQCREFRRVTNNYGFETLRTYIQKEGKKMRKLEDVPYSLDFFNNHALKLRQVMNDTLVVLQGCAGASLSGHILSVDVLSYPTLTVCAVEINLNDYLLLDQLILHFHHKMGRLDEQAISALTQIQPPKLQNFVRAIFAYIHTEEARFGVFTDVPPLLF